MAACQFCFDLTAFKDLYACVLHVACDYCGVTGIAMVTFGDSRNRSGQQSFQGDMLCLLSSLFYAAYTVAIRKLLPADDHANISVLLGLIGIFNLIGMAPVLLLLWLTSIISLSGVSAWLILLTVCKGKSQHEAVVTSLLSPQHA